MESISIDRRVDRYMEECAERTANNYREDLEIVLLADSIKSPIEQLFRLAAYHADQVPFIEYQSGLTLAYQYEVFGASGSKYRIDFAVQYHDETGEIIRP